MQRTEDSHNSLAYFKSADDLIMQHKKIGTPSGLVLEVI
jgi:hypothetical protein